MKAIYFGKYILIFVLAFSVRIQSQQYSWQRRQPSSASRSGFIQTRGRPQGTYGIFLNQAVSASRGFQNNQRRTISSRNNKRLWENNDTVRIPITRVTHLGQIRPTTPISRVNTQPSVKNNQNFSRNRVTSYPIKNRNVLHRPDNHVPLVNSSRNKDSLKRRNQNLLPNLNPAVLITPPLRKFSTSSKPSLQPPAGYKIAYCKIFNTTHQLVTLTPLQQPSTQVARRIPHSGSRNNHFHIQTNIIPRSQPARYVIIRTEDYVVCSRNPPTTTLPLHIPTGHLHPSSNRTSSRKEQKPNKVLNHRIRVSQNTQNSKQTRSRLKFRPRGQVSRSFSNSQRNHNVNKNSRAHRPNSFRNVPHRLVSKSAYTLKPPASHVVKSIPRVFIPRLPYSNKHSIIPDSAADRKNLPDNTEKGTNTFTISNPISVLRSTTTELSSLYSDLLQTIKKFQGPITTIPSNKRQRQPNRKLQPNSRNSKKQNINRGAISRKNRTRPVSKTTGTSRTRPVSKITGMNRTRPVNKTASMNRTRRISKTVGTNRTRIVRKETRINRTSSARKTPSRPKTRVTAMLPELKTTPKPRTTTTTKSRPRSQILSRRPTSRWSLSQPPLPHQRSVDHEIIRIYIPPSLRKEIDTNKKELLKLDEEALEEIIEEKVEEKGEEEEIEEEEKEKETLKKEIEEIEVIEIKDDIDSTKPSPRQRSVRSSIRPQIPNVRKPRRFRVTRSLPFV